MQNVLGVFKQFGHYSVGKRYIYPFPVKNFECLPSIKYAGLLSTAIYPPPPLIFAQLTGQNKGRAASSAFLLARKCK